MAGRSKHLIYLSRYGIRLRTYIHQSGVLFIVVMLMILNACAGTFMSSNQANGVYHLVKKGETLYRIAQVYAVPLQHLAEVNNIDQGDILEVGRVLFIPDAQAVVEDILVAVKKQEALKSASRTPAAAQKRPSQKDGEVPLPTGSGGSGTKRAVTGQSSKEKDQSVLLHNKPSVASPGDKTIFPLKLPSANQTEGNDGGNAHSEAEEAKTERENRVFSWPVTGKIVSRYGIQPNGMFYNGITIAAPEGTPVTAAADGIVIFSAPLRDYGETIILKHDNDYASVYTLLGQRLVKLEDPIKKGDKIATMAKSETKGDSRLNFEIRYKNIARNPLLFLK